MIAAVSRGAPWLRRYGRALTYAGRDQLAYPAALLTRGVLLVIFVFVFNTVGAARSGCSDGTGSRQPGRHTWPTRSRSRSRWSPWRPTERHVHCILGDPVRSLDAPIGIELGRSAVRTGTVRRQSAAHPAGIGLFLLFVLLAAGVLVAVRVLYHSLTFLLGNAEALAGVCSEQIITFSLYPGAIFDAPVVAVILHTLIPAALVVHLSADLFRAVARGTGLDWGLLAVVIGGDAALIAAACAVFALGLRRYESGNRIGARI